MSLVLTLAVAACGDASAYTEASSTDTQLEVTTASAALGLPTAGLVFSSVWGHAPAAQQVTFRNTGQTLLHLRNIQVSGGDFDQFRLAAGQPTSLTIAPGDSATATVAFRPSAPTGCPTAANPASIGDVTRAATLTFYGNIATGTGGVPLNGLVACGAGGNQEPVLDQITEALGYSSVVVTAADQRRWLGFAGPVTGTSEVASPYFVAANPRQPVTLTPAARYTGLSPVSVGSAGWYERSSPPTTPCNAACHPLWAFPLDTTTAFVENQKLLPTPIGQAGFRPTSAFGLFYADGTDVNFSDDQLNTATTIAGTGQGAVQHIHNIRIFRACGPGHVVIPNTYLIAVDSYRASADKNGDFQDAVLVLRNATPVAGN
jgi:hypothetical protein